MKIKLAIIVVIISCAVAGLYFDTVKQPRVYNEAGQMSAEISWSKAPDLVFKDVNGTRYNLKELYIASDNVLLNFWATWCAPCVKEIPYLLSLAGKREDDLVLVLISVDNKDTDLDHFFKKLGTQAPDYKAMHNVILVHDVDRLIAEDQFQVFKFPESFLINDGGYITNKFVRQTELEYFFDNQ